VIYWARFDIDTLAIQCGTTAQLADWEHEYSWGKAHREVLVQTDRPYEPEELYVDIGKGRKRVPQNNKTWVMRRFVDDEPIAEVAPLTVEYLGRLMLAVAAQANSARTTNAVNQLRAATTREDVERILQRYNLAVDDGEVSMAQWEHLDPHMKALLLGKEVD
jgi:hypothetical protein